MIHTRFRMNNKNLKFCIIPNRYKLIARKSEESKISSYKLLFDDVKNKIINLKNIYVSNLISQSDQYDISMQFEQQILNKKIIILLGSK